MKEIETGISTILAENKKIIDYLKYNCSNKKIKIPRYQREYSWKEKNVKTLLEDFKADYYIGNVVVYEYKENNIEIKEIVDGQQRIITIFLILIGIMEKTTNEEICNEILSSIINSSKQLKLDLKARIGSDGIDLMNFILDDGEIPNELVNKYNELKIYKFIKKELKNYDINDLYNKIKQSSLVEISFTRNEISAHEMFVNVNTKGKKLTNIEVLKSQLFKYLLNGENSDSYKESWQIMLENIPSNQYDNYCSDIYLFKYFEENKNADVFNTKGTIDVNGIELIESINSYDKADEIFKMMTGNKSEDVFRVYSAIKNYDINSLKRENIKYFSRKMDEKSIDLIDSIWRMYGEFGFKQSDILFVTLLTNKETFLSGNLTYFITFMKYIFIFELYRSVLGTSPAQYSNSFKQVSARLFSVKEPSQIKKIIRNFIKGLEIGNSEQEKLKTALNDPTTFIKNYKRAKYIIMLSENIYMTSLTVEHFINQKTTNNYDNKYIGELGNLIPVLSDTYKNKAISEKLELYNKDKDSDIAIANFLNYNFNISNYSEKIRERTKDISTKFIKKLNDYYELIMNEYL